MTSVSKMQTASNMKQESIVQIRIVSKTRTYAVWMLLSYIPDYFSQFQIYGGALLLQSFATTSYGV